MNWPGEEAATLTLPGLDEDQLRKLSEAGLDTADRLLEATTEQLTEVAGIDQAAAEQLPIDGPGAGRRGGCRSGDCPARGEPGCPRRRRPWREGRRDRAGSRN